jgi:hypothetical protein
MCSGIHFLPLDKTLYLRVQSFINMTESAFPDVAYTCFLYASQLVFSGLEQDDMRTLYRYITAGFLQSLPMATRPAEEVRVWGDPQCGHYSGTLVPSTHTSMTPSLCLSYAMRVLADAGGQEAGAAGDAEPAPSRRHVRGSPQRAIPSLAR